MSGRSTRPNFTTPYIGLEARYVSKGCFDARGEEQGPLLSTHAKRAENTNVGERWVIG